MKLKFRPFGAEETISRGRINGSMQELYGAASGSVGEIRLTVEDLEAESEGAWLACDGRELPSSEYAELFAKIGYRFGPVMGSQKATAGVPPDFYSMVGVYKIDELNFGIAYITAAMNRINLGCITFSEDYSSHSHKVLGTIVYDNYRYGYTLTKLAGTNKMCISSLLASSNFSNVVGYASVFNITAEIESFNLIDFQYNFAPWNGASYSLFRPEYYTETNKLHIVVQVRQLNSIIWVMDLNKKSSSTISTDMGSENYLMVPTHFGVYYLNTRGSGASYFYNVDNAKQSFTLPLSPSSCAIFDDTVYISNGTTTYVADKTAPTACSIGKFPAVLLGVKQNVLAGYVEAASGEPFSANIQLLNGKGTAPLTKMFLCVFRNGVITPVLQTAQDSESYIIRGMAGYWYKSGDKLLISDDGRQFKIPERVAGDYLIPEAGTAYLEWCHPVGISYIKARN